MLWVLYFLVGSRACGENAGLTELAGACLLTAVAGGVSYYLLTHFPRCSQRVVEDDGADVEKRTAGVEFQRT